MSSKTKITATKEEIRPTLVPKLRFSEFRGAPGWEQTTLGAIARLKNGYAFKSADYLDSGPFQIITIANVQQGALALEAVKRIAQPPADIQTHQKLCIGDILISMTGNVGRVCRVTCDSLLLNQRVGKLIPEEIGPEFFYHSLQRDEFRNAMQLKAAGGAQGNLSGGDITDYPLYRPVHDAEQQKIASCLSSVDELMAAQARKVDALKTHKKGLMQQLFPREGETQPRLRFPEFQDAGEWASEPLGDLGEIVTGKTPSTKEADLWGGDIFFITPTDISEDNKYQRTTTRTVLATKNTKILPAGSVVYTCIASIGKMALTVHPSITNQQINAVVPNENVLGEFIYYALANLTPWIKTLPATNTLPIINKTDFSKIGILLPENKTEQQRIATCLTSLDALITAETQKHEALKTHKKGLMQQLFPSPEELAE